LKNIVQSLVNGAGWASGNAMAFYINGTGTREVESFDGDGPKAPLLVIEYLGGTSGGTVFTPNPIGTFQLKKNHVGTFRIKETNHQHFGETP